MNRKEANAGLRTVNIKGKDYVEVAERDRAFWELFPNGSIETEVVYNDWKVCLIKATVSDGEGHHATGHAFEERKGAINMSSFIENCETSAVGRALGLFGIGSAASIASADEMQMASQVPHPEVGEALLKKEADEQLAELQREVEKARGRLVKAEKAYADCFGMEFNVVHTETIGSRDYERACNGGKESERKYLEKRSNELEEKVAKAIISDELSEEEVSF